MHDRNPRQRSPTNWLRSTDQVRVERFLAGRRHRVLTQPVPANTVVRLAGNDGVPPACDATNDASLFA